MSSENTMDYDKLIDEFGCQRINPAIIQLINQVIENRGLSQHKEKYMYYFTRDIFFSHRDFYELLVNYLKGEQFYIYTGRGPSTESMHIGHLIPFQMTQILQELFDVHVVIQLTDDEKYYYNNTLLNLEDYTKMAYENIKDIISCGFNPDKTFIFINTQYIQHLFPTVVKIQKLVNFNQIKAIFGCNEQSSLGRLSFPAMQAAPAFSCCFPHIFPNKLPVRCLIPCAIDQDPYFRLTRDIAPRLGYLKPALLHARFLPSLQGIHSKMSSSIPDSVIFLSESDNLIKKKINKSFSGGGCSLEEHKLHGANLQVDVPFHYLKFLLRDENQFKSIGDSYQKGELSTGEVKKITIQLISEIIGNHKNNRKLVTDKILHQFMKF